MSFLQLVKGGLEINVRRRMKNESERTTNKVNGRRNVRNLACSKTADMVMKVLFPYAILQYLVQIGALNSALLVIIWPQRTEMITSEALLES